MYNNLRLSGKVCWLVSSIRSLVGMMGLALALLGMAHITKACVPPIPFVHVSNAARECRDPRDSLRNRCIFFRNSFCSTYEFLKDPPGDSLA